MDIIPIVKNKNYSEKNGVFYFGEIPSGIKPSRDENPQNQNEWSYWRKSNYEFFKKELSRLSKELVLLDVGAGQSDFTDITSQFKLCAVDFYPYPGVTVVCDFTKELPLADASADILMLSNVLEHVPEPNTLLEECRRVLKPGGIMLGSVPFMIQIHQRPYDFFRYTEMNLEYILKKHNFKDSVIQPVLATRVYLFNAATSFFVHAIRTSQSLERIFLRILWIVVRGALKTFDGIFKRYDSDPNTPLGYLLKARR